MNNLLEKYLHHIQEDDRLYSNPFPPSYGRDTNRPHTPAPVKVKEPEVQKEDEDTDQKVFKLKK